VIEIGEGYGGHGTFPETFGRSFTIG